jgi:hypothetical protein
LSHSIVQRDPKSNRIIIKRGGIILEDGDFGMMPQQQYMRFVWRVLCLAALSRGFGGTAAAQTAPRPSLTVTPSSSVNISGPQGGPFSPWSIQYRLSASTGTIKFAIAAPFWLRADPRVGMVGIDSVTVTLSLNPQASKLSPQAYEAPVTFINVTNGQGTTRTTAKLTVEPSSRGYLLDESGGYLLGNRGERLLAR